MSSTIIIVMFKSASLVSHTQTTFVSFLYILDKEKGLDQFTGYTRLGT